MLKSSTSIANISGMDRRNGNLKTAFSTANKHSAIGWKKIGELLSTIKKVIGVKVECRPTQVTFYNISTVRGCCRLKFLHTLQPTKLYFKSDLERRAASSWALPHISSCLFFKYFYFVVRPTVFV